MTDLSLTRLYDSDALWSWAQFQLPTLNHQVLSRMISLETFVSEINLRLRKLTDPTLLSPEECKRQLVILGMLGSSVERHSQQAGNPVGRGIQSLTTGMGCFSRYLATLAARVGGPPRDSFRSYVIWNVPTVSVYLPGEERPCYTLPGVFPDSSAPVTFSDDLGETNSLFHLKRRVALEAAANASLWGVVLLDLRLHQAEALHHLEVATLLLCAVREEMLTFMQCPEFTAPFFSDGLHQYACSWDAAETYSPPSGAHDHEFIIRDYLLGMSIEDNHRHGAALFHVLDYATQQELDTARGILPLSTRIAWQLGMDSLDELETYPLEAVPQLIKLYPWLSACYHLYQANAELSATHRSMVSRYILKPIRTCDEGGSVISNDERCTHMGMHEVEHFMHSRKLHPLQSLKEFVPSQTLTLSSEQLLTLARS